MKKLNLYKIYRFSCNMVKSKPTNVIVVAENKFEADKIVRKKFGNCQQHIHRIKMNKPDILLAHNGEHYETY